MEITILILAIIAVIELALIFRANKEIIKAQEETSDVYDDLNKIIDFEIDKREELEKEVSTQTRLKEKYYPYYKTNKTMKIDDLKEELEYKKSTHRKLLKLMGSKSGVELAKILNIADTRISEIRNGHITSVKTANKYITILEGIQ